MGGATRGGIGNRLGTESDTAIVRDEVIVLTKPQLVTNGMMGNGLNTPKSTGSPTTNGVGTGYTDKGVATRLCDEAPSAADNMVTTPTGGMSINDAMKQVECRTWVGIEHGVWPSQTDKGLATAGVPIMVTRVFHN